MPTPAPTAFQPPYIGAAYYPEAWPVAQIDDDIARMREYGMNVMRIGEFAWSTMEPREGDYQFAWLHHVIGKLADAGIATILCTPSCTPPIWLTEKHPEILFAGLDGRAVTHGARRHTCPNSPIYRDYCVKIATRMAEEFGHDARVIGWQIDNELYPFQAVGTHSRSCTCAVCHAGFAEFLRKRFGAIEALNEAWCTALWSQTYQRFDQVPIPRHDVWHHPSLLTAWDEFTSRSYAEFAAVQARALRLHTTQPIGTDMMPLEGLDHRAMHRELDVVQFNHYNSIDNLWHANFWFDYLRPLKPVPFWNTETATGWPASTTVPWGAQPPGFCRINSWAPLALGGEANLYWLWRTHRAGQELLHGSVLTTHGRPMPMVGEVREVAHGFAAAGDFLRATRVEQPRMALHFSHLAAWQWRYQPHIDGFNYLAALIGEWYRPLTLAQYRLDVLHPEGALTPYKIIFSPLLSTLDEGNLSDRLRAWIEAGGIWVAGPHTGIRDAHGAKPPQGPLGVVEEWARVHVRYEVPGGATSLALKWAGSHEATAGRTWHYGFENRTDDQSLSAETLAVWQDAPLEGLAAAVRVPMGAGSIILLGTQPGPADIQRLVARLAAEVEIAPTIEGSPTLLAVPRAGNGRSGIIVIEMANKPADMRLPRSARDVVTGRTYHGKVEIDPCQVLVLEYV